ncbi:unnamed protein product, partial [Symbiodinium natans]
ALVKWNADAARVDIGWIGEKLDYMHAINTAYMQEIKDVVSGASGAEDLLQGTQAATDSL